MINPNKTYSATQTGVITKIETGSDYAQFTVSYRSSGEYVGYVSNIKNFKRFKLGDRVKAGMNFSICLDKFLVVRLRKVNS